WTTNPLPAGSPEAGAEAGAAFASAAGAIRFAGSFLVTAGFPTTTGALFANPESRVADPGFSLSSTGSCPSRRLGYVSVSCEATGALLVTAAAGASGTPGVVPDVGSVA